MVRTPVPPPDNIENITVTGQEVEVAYPTGERTVTVRVNFTWTEPNVPYGSLKNYDVWFDRDLLLPGDNRILPREPIPVNFMSFQFSYLHYLCVCVCVYVCMCCACMWGVGRGTHTCNLWYILTCRHLPGIPQHFTHLLPMT